MMAKLLPLFVMRSSVVFPSGKVDYHYEAVVGEVLLSYDQNNMVMVTDEHVARLYPGIFKNRATLVIPPSEKSKDIDTIKSLAKEMLTREVTRDALIVGVGGGVITDITGFLASTYMRGIRFGFVPTTLLGMVDAAIGGKNGVNVSLHKNILGTIAQPEFIVYDTSFLNTLPDDDWSNGFAEIIKYACLFDPEMFDELLANKISYYRDLDDGALTKLVHRCAEWKNKIVAEDEYEHGQRKLLNFGHTAAHAIENLYEIPHGKAVGIGMLIACMISEEATGLNKEVTRKLRTMLDQYHLPVRMNIDTAKAMDILKMDKKRVSDTINYILLEDIGRPVIKALSFDIIEKSLKAYEDGR